MDKIIITPHNTAIFVVNGENIVKTKYTDFEAVESLIEKLFDSGAKQILFWDNIQLNILNYYGDTKDIIIPDTDRWYLIQEKLNFEYID